MDYTLVIMAAGMGSRFGSLKQIEPVGPNGEFIIDYSVYDAIKAGFNKIVFVIRKDFYKEFKATIGKRLEGKVSIEYVFQEIDDLPLGYVCHSKRVKPWGTGAAIYSARHVLNGPFAIINADDFYGFEAYDELFKAVISDEAMVLGYKAGNTLSLNGTVKRGIISSSNEKLEGILESKMEVCENKIKATPLDGRESFYIPLDTLVSMNAFVFTLDVLKVIIDDFSLFLDEHLEDLNDEYLIPNVINDEISKGNISLKVRNTDSKWFGVTYKEDKERVVETVSNYISKGVYPKRLVKK